jgi:C4-dicarboxylate transporter DctQ subunit
MIHRLASVIDRVTDWLTKMVEWFGIAMIVGSASIAFVSVIMRYGFGASDQLIDEIARYTIIYACFLYAGSCLKSGQHIAVDIISGHLTPVVRRVRQLALSVLFLIVAVYLFLAGYAWVSDLMSYEMTTMGGTMPAYIPALSVPLGMGLAVLYGINEVLRSLISVFVPEVMSAMPAASQVVEGEIK